MSVTKIFKELSEVGYVETLLKPVKVSTLETLGAHYYSVLKLLTGFAIAALIAW
jgi:hypothetical protein